MKFKPKITRLRDRYKLASALADLIRDSANRSVKVHGRFTLALSGGSTPRVAHAMLAKEPYVSEIPWEHTYIFWVDERCIPFTDPASNYGNARLDFLMNVPIHSDHVFPMPGEKSPSEGSLEYDSLLKDFFKLSPGGHPRFNLILLGLGADGHMASLFPGHESLEEKDRSAVNVLGGTPLVNRLTLTLPVLNNAERVVFHVSGWDKAGIVKGILEESDPKLPATRVSPVTCSVEWYLDAEAASELSMSFFLSTKPEHP
jgi:6-phosphogluconolactonase